MVKIACVGSQSLRSEENASRDCLGPRLLAQAPSLLPWLEQLALVAVHNVPVLLTGETGTGKSYLARLIHHCSPRRDHRFLTVPCAALSVNLIESELFGHVRGAFTGADVTKVGKFEAAGEGTIFLDEIDTLSLEAQSGLLRIIETGEYEPVGSNETRMSKARVIVASNWDLEGAVKAGKFRADLFYRLHVMAFHLPPLRERLQDIDPLVREMLGRFAGRFHKSLCAISPKALAALKAFPWPGNIRQLENVLQQAVLVSNGPELKQEDLPHLVQDYPSVKDRARLHDSSTLFHNREVAERHLIQRALANNGFNRVETARSLGISRVTLYKKMKRHGITTDRRPSATNQANVKKI